MPTSEQILNDLQRIANDWRVLAVFWHAYFALLLIRIFVAGRLLRRNAAILLALPVLSVSLLAWISGNPFNGTLFALAGMILLFVSSRLPANFVEWSPAWALGTGAILVIFGWLYPHFLETPSYLAYFYAAPTGLIPCPTLSMVVGFLLILDGLRSKAFSLVASAAGLFYGIFGAFKLGVMIDLVLLFGSIVLIVFSIAELTAETAGTAK